MFVRSIRVLIGFALACFAAALTLVLFVYTPAELAGLPADMSSERLFEAATFALAITPHIAVFAGLPALIAVSFGEGRGVGAWAFYVVVGIGIAALGFLVQHFTEAPNQATILRNYALTAFLSAGLAAGLVYWLFAGRAAGASGPQAPPPAAPAARPVPTATPDTPVTT